MSLRGSGGYPQHGGRPPANQRSSAPQGGIYLEGEPIPPPDHAITEFEDAVVANARNVPGAMTMGNTLPRRPGYGTMGTAIVLRTNYLVMRPRDREQTLWHYTVKMDEEKLSKAKKARLFQLLLAMPPFKDINAVTDHASMIFTTARVDLGSNDRKEMEVDVTWYDARESPFPEPTPNEEAGRTKARKRRTRKMHIEFRRTVAIGQLWQYLASPQLDDPHAVKTLLVQALNLIMSKSPASHSLVASVGQNRYFPFAEHPGRERYDLGQGLHVLRGYFSSVRLAAMRVLLNVNVTNAAFYNDGPLLSLINSYIGRSRGEQELLSLDRFLRRLRVSTFYMKEKDSDGTEKTTMKLKTILQLARKPRVGANSLEVKFEYKPNKDSVARDISVEQYFREKYGIKLNHPEQPVLNCGTTEDPQYIPPELCTVLPGQPARQKLTAQQTRQMITFAVRGPDINAHSIANNGLRLLHITDQTAQDRLLDSFGVQVDPNMLTVPARILNPPRLQFSGNKTVTPSRGSWNMANNRFHTAARLPKWSLLVINNRANRHTLSGDLNGRARKFRDELRRYGMTVPDPAPARTLQINSLSRRDLNDFDKEIGEIMQKARTSGIGALLIVLPEKNDPLYSRIKFHGDVKAGLHTVDVTAQNFEPMKEDLIANLALKFNQKCGGVNWDAMSGMPGIVDDKTMVVGIDVTHPSPGSMSNAPSIAGIVASVNKDLSQWPGDVTTQTSRKEMVEKLEALVVGRLGAWQRFNNKSLPRKIIVYRDGVSEGQFKTVLEEEHPAMVRAFEKVYGAKAKHPKVVIMVVGKRHHTRFYPTDRKHAEGRKHLNPKPGTVVDRHITGYGEKVWDFFLQAHNAIQGTARPAHYIGLLDEIGMGADEAQRMTLNMCHSFGRATKAVSICPPAYYADLICERGRSYLWSTMNNDAGSDDGFNPNTAEWTEGVHAALRDTTFYI